MIQFMLLGTPRSATTWAANWLTTDTTLCLHDPLFRYHYTELDNIKSSRSLGVACTGLGHFTDWINSHPARKVIVHRNLGEVNQSLREIGLPAMTEEQAKKLDLVKGLHVDWLELFDSPEKIYEYLLQMPFDSERHEFLCEIEMQPHFGRLKVGPDVTKKLLAEMVRW